MTRRDVRSEGCWAVEDEYGSPFGGDEMGWPHYPTSARAKAAAFDDLVDVLADWDEEDGRPALPHVRQLPAPCVTIVCDAPTCPAALDPGGYGSTHLDPDELGYVPADCGWATRGPRHYCPTHAA